MAGRATRPGCGDASARAPRDLDRVAEEMLDLGLAPDQISEEEPAQLRAVCTARAATTTRPCGGQTVDGAPLAGTSRPARTGAPGTTDRAPARSRNVGGEDPFLAIKDAITRGRTVGFVWWLDPCVVKFTGSGG